MTKLVVGNLKANILTLAERERYLAALAKNMAGKKWKNAELVICPPFAHLEHFVKNIKNKGTKVGAQNAFWENGGSFTGEVTMPMIKNIGAEYIIIGHSERRKYFGETNETANFKIKSALKNNLLPIYCVGETRQERESGMMKKIVENQVLVALDGILGNRLEKIIIAYEPVWAVGTDVCPSSNEIMEARILIKKILAGKFGMKKAEKVKILYGGSVNPKMVDQVCINPGMDGALVGRQSLIPSELVKIAEVINKS